MPATGLTSEKWGFPLIAAFLLRLGWEGLNTGRSTLFLRDVTRSEDGYLYWWAIGMWVAGGVFFLAYFVKLLVS